MKPRVTIKYVKKAGQWCTTTHTFENGKNKFIREWSDEKPIDLVKHEPIPNYIQE